MSIRVQDRCSQRSSLQMDSRGGFRRRDSCTVNRGGRNVLEGPFAVLASYDIVLSVVCQPARMATWRAFEVPWVPVICTRVETGTFQCATFQVSNHGSSSHKRTDRACVSLSHVDNLVSPRSGASPAFVCFLNTVLTER